MSCKWSAGRVINKIKFKIGLHTNKSRCWWCKHLKGKFSQSKTIFGSHAKLNRGKEMEQQISILLQTAFYLAD